MQESCGYSAGKVQRIDVLRSGERGPSDPRLDTCTGSLKGAGLLPREIDFLCLFLLSRSQLWWRRRRKGARMDDLSPSRETNDPVASHSGEEL